MPFSPYNHLLVSYMSQEFLNKKQVQIYILIFFLYTQKIAYSVFICHLNCWQYLGMYGFLLLPLPGLLFLALTTLRNSQRPAHAFIHPAHILELMCHVCCVRLWEYKNPHWSNNYRIPAVIRAAKKGYLLYEQVVWGPAPPWCGGVCACWGRHVLRLLAWRGTTLAGVWPGLRVWYRVPWKAGSLTSVASLLPLPKSVGCLGPLQPYPL